jgi:meso-butanediol dehydrogenase/(S,S)-butanediol dehydrogenase/diacetyl reductase
VVNVQQDRDGRGPTGPSVVVLTGAEGGIGAATARALAAAGTALVLVGLDALRLRALAGELDANAIVGDAGERDVMDGAVDAAEREHGGLDALITCVGTSAGAALLDTDEADWRAIMHANLDTAFVSAQAAVPALVRRGGGSVVVTASLAALQAPPRNVGYTASKHALLGLVRSIARDYGPGGVRANAVCPGWTSTPMADGVMDTLGGVAGLSREQAWSLAVSDLPLGRAATPEEVAGVIVFLAGGASAMISGQAVVVDGGASAVDVPSVALMRELARAT